MQKEDFQPVSKERDDAFGAGVVVEFFHDTICSFCFPMSFRMRKVSERWPLIKIVHRSFALARDAGDFNRMFGSRAEAKEEILQHWAHANENDDLHRFNVEGMRRQSFLFPCSMHCLLACKAAWFLGGDAGYWDLFDALQRALFVESRDVDSLDVIEEYVRGVGLDVAAWRAQFAAAATLAAVEADLELARRYRITSVPTLVVNGRYRLSGAVSADVLFEQIAACAGGGM